MSATPSSSLDRIELVVSRPGHPDRYLMLKAGVISLGRAEDNDLVLPDIGVSRHHARITVDHTGITIEDLGSGNGTLFQGRPVRKKRIEDGDILQIDPFRLRFQLHLRDDAPPSPAASSSSLPGVARSGNVPRLVLTSDTEMDATVFPVLPSGLAMGRATDQGVVLTDPAASRRHAAITWRQGSCWIQDAGSANGTFVNDEPVYQPHMLAPGDVVRIGQTTFRFEQGTSSADPLSGMWADSGVWQRPVQDDEPAPLVPTFPPVGPSAPTRSRPPRPAAGVPTIQGGARRASGSGAGQGRVLLLAGMLLLGLVVLVVLLLAVVPIVLSQLAAPGPAVAARRPPDTSLPGVAAGAEAGQRMISARALLAADRPLEAATLLYQALDQEPHAQELRRLGYAACEAAALQILREDLQRQGQPDLDSRAVQALVRAAERAGDEELVDLRLQLASALRAVPGDAGLISALGRVDSRLAGLAAATVEAASAEGVAPDAAWAQLQQALALAPTSSMAARVAWARLAPAQGAAYPLTRQALALEIGGQLDVAAGLYGQVAEILPGEAEYLERMALARRKTLAP